MRIRIARERAGGLARRRKGRRRRGVLGRPYRRYLAAGLEDGARGAVEDDCGLDAGFLVEAAQRLFERVCSVALLIGYDQVKRCCS